MQRAAGLIAAGRLVVIPTETVYGLAANALDDRAVASIYALKNRPQFNPLIIHFLNRSLMESHVIFNPDAEKLAQAFWPGPLTMILPRQKTSKISLLASAGLDTLAVRIPQHPVTLDLLKLTALPLAAPSANPSQGLSPTCASHVAMGFNDVENLPLIIDGGTCSLGLESTIIDLSQDVPTVLRPGIITADHISQVLGKPVRYSFENSDKPKAPGQLHRHYAPALPVRLNATCVKDTEALLCFGTDTLPGAAMTLNLSPASDLCEAAANLFKMLHQVDQAMYTAIAVMPIPNEGIGIAINDRLKRAAHQSG